MLYSPYKATYQDLFFSLIEYRFFLRNLIFFNEKKYILKIRIRPLKELHNIIACFALICKHLIFVPFYLSRLAFQPL